MRPLHLLLFLAASCVPLGPIKAEERRPIQQTPVIVGRPIERFVLLDPIIVPAAKVGPVQAGYLLLAGQYVPVAEDKDGVYFQSQNGLRDGYGAEAVRPGGVWVSKKKAGVMHPYAGAAKGSEEVRVRWHQPLSLEEMKQFRVAQAEKPGKRK